MPRHAPRCRAALICALHAGCWGANVAYAQSIVVNGDFDADAQLDGWLFADTPELSASWLDADADDDPASGSILIGNHSANASNGVVVEQCRPAQAGGEYRFGGRARLPAAPGQNLSGRGSIAVRWASDDDCSVFLGGSVGTANSFDAFDTWVQRQATRDAPAGAHSVLVRALVSKVEPGGSLFVQFDDIYLLPPDGIFGNGFELLPE